MDKQLLELCGLEPEEALKLLNSSMQGLSENEAKIRIQKYGHNLLDKSKKVNIIWEFLSYFKSPLILILLLATVVSAYFGEVFNAFIIAAIILLSVILNFVEEHTSGKAVEKLIDSVKITATVVRSAKKIELPTKDVCVGDIIFLSSGDLIPADARILSAKDFFVNQSALTGESYPLQKKAEKIDSKELKNIVELKKYSVGELNNLVFSGTNVVSGSATALVFKTGMDTEFGKIAINLTKAASKSEFEIGITHFGYFIIRIMLFLVLFIFLFNSLVKHKILESFMFAVAIAVGITPELLTMIMSVTMAKGSINMAKKGVIVKKLISIPNFGSMDVLCTDKTGTLTQDKITLVKYIDTSGKNSEKVLLYTYLNSFYQTGIKNPLDQAVLDFKKVGISNYQKIDEIPFDFFRKRISIIVSENDLSKDNWDKLEDNQNKMKDNQSKLLLITKGAPEEIFKLCVKYAEHDSQHSQSLAFGKQAQALAMKRYRELSEQGYRVLALATKKFLKPKNKYSKDDESSLELQGLVAFFDQPKTDVKEVLQHLEELGVEIKVVTGDNELVTKKVCEELNLKVKGILLGQEIDTLTDDALKARIENTTIFARFSPDEKNRIIHLLKSNNHVVGYLGDGINDAPSLRDADVGISVNNAVDVAKESADLVLTHKSLGVLRNGIIEGRKVFGNTMKYILMGLSSSFGNMFSAAGAILFLPFLPMLPIQILLNNLIYDFSQITIPSDNVDKDWINKPKRWNLRFIKHFMYVFGPISSFFDFLTFFVLFFLLKVSESTFQTSWFMESLATQILVIHVIRTKKIPFLESRASIYLILSTVACIIVGWTIPYTFIGRYFGFEPLSLKVILILVAIVFAYLFVIEFVKRWFYKKFNF